MITNHIYLLFVQEKEVDHETQQQKQTETTEIKEKMWCWERYTEGEHITFSYISSLFGRYSKMHKNEKHMQLFFLLYM